MEAAEQTALARRRLAYTFLGMTTGAVVLLMLVVSSGQNLRSVLGSNTLTNLASSNSVTIKSLEASSSRVYYAQLKGSEKKSLFDDYKTQYSKSYSSDDEDTRYSNFKKFLERIDERNDAEALADNSAVHGVTQFADLSEDEVKKYLLGYKAADKEAKRKLKSSKLAKVAKVEKYKGSSTTVDWADTYTTSVSDQGY